MVHDVGISAFGRALNVLICAYKIAKRNRGDLYAEHGLACHIELQSTDAHTPCYSTSAALFKRPSANIDALKIDFDKLEALALSHGHQDHCGALLGILKTRREKISTGIPLYVGEDAFYERGAGKRVVHVLPKRRT